MAMYDSNVTICAEKLYNEKFIIIIIIIITYVCMYKYGKNEMNIDINNYYEKYRNEKRIFSVSPRLCTYVNFIIIFFPI
jgi:hypothetical protein